jgi:hypothetical protein
MAKLNYVEELKELMGVDIAPYKKHPRIVELKLVLLYETIIMNWGASKGTEFFKMLSDFFNLDWTKINGIIQQKHLIKKVRNGKAQRFKQEIVFAATVYNEPTWYIATRYLRVTPDYFYRRRNPYKVKNFATKEWLAGLEENVVVCGIEGLRLEALRYLEGFEAFMEVFGNVSISGQDLRGYGATIKL